MGEDQKIGDRSRPPEIRFFDSSREVGCGMGNKFDSGDTACYIPSIKSFREATS
jgi:hypothetical protein